MPYYEHIFIARQDVSGQHVEELTGQLSEIITQGGGTVTKTETWGLRNLAYRIKKNRKGHYVLLNIDAPVPAMAEMERIIRLNSDVIRHMTLRVDALDTEPSIMMKIKAARESRGPRPHHGRRPGDRSFGDRPTGGRPTGDRPSPDKPSPDKPSPDKPAGDKPAGGKPAAEPAVTAKPTTTETGETKS